MTCPPCRFVPLSLAIVTSLVPAAGAAAQDRFEIQVYDVETAPPAGFGVELHTNYVASGTRQASPDGELPTDRVTHLTLEPHLGLADWCELGGYLQSAIQPDGRFWYAGAKIRFKARVPGRMANDLLGLALNVELSAVPATYEANVFGSELRPIVDLQWKRLYAAVNPIIDVDLAGPLAGRPQLEPAAKVALTAFEGFRAGFEYYSGLGPVTGFYPFAQETHQLYAAVDYVHRVTPDVSFDLNLGVGYNLVGTGDRWVGKLIIGIGE